MKQIIIFRADLKLGKGKLAAHAGHAAIVGYLNVLKKRPRDAQRWLSEGQKKIVLKISDEQTLLDLYERIKKEGYPVEIVRDAGLTQVAPGTIVCLVIGPAEDERVDEYTKDLKLL